MDELIIAGDLWDRGPRGDRVMDYLRLQPNVEFIWGNHDVSWLGASRGHEALICTVLRISLRYRRLGQLDEGYSVPLTRWSIWLKQFTQMILPFISCLRQMDCDPTY